MYKILAVLGLCLVLSSCSKKPVYPEALSDDRYVRIELGRLSEKKPVFYTFRAVDGKGINYFVLKLNGGVQSYFDSCAKCYPKKLGYLPVNGHLLCRVCNIEYSVHDLKDGIGSCYPIKLKGTVERGYYLIDKSDLLQGAKYF